MLGLIPLSFERPDWLWLLLVVPVAVVVPLVVRSLAALPAGRRWFSLTTRAALLVTLILAMAGAQYVRESRNLAVLFLLDRSKSIPEDLKLQQEEFIRQVGLSRNRPRDDKAGVISFDGKSNIEQKPMRGVFIERIAPAVEPDRTDLSAAIRLALATFPEGYAKRIVLLSDGNQNAGDVLTEVGQAASNNVGVDVVPLEYEHKNEVMFDRMVAPAQANLDDHITLRMILRSKQPSSGKLVLYHNDQRISSDTVALKAGINPLLREVSLSSVGVHRFEARFEPDDPAMDEVMQNNVARAFTFVQGEGSVLLLTTEPSCDVKMEEALKKEHVKVDMVSMDDAPEDILEMLDYESIILSNVPADRFTEDQKQQLASYVRDLGGGLIMTGGNEGFGVGGWLGSPVEDVMPLKFDVKQRKQIPRGALVLILHTCEMPRGNYWAEQVAIAAINTISRLDYLGLIAYGFKGGTTWEIPFQVAQNKNRIINRVRKISNRIGDMPDFGSGMEMAYQKLKAAPGVSQKHIIIISDGDATAPSSNLISKMKRAKITCSTVAIGFGAHVQVSTMKRIAKQTGGRFYKVNNPRKLPQIFVKEAKVVRRPLIREVTEGFKPHLRITMPEITAGVSDAELPLLYGHILTTPRTTASEFSRILMASDKEDPLLAVRQCELGKSVAFTSGWWTRWGRQWPSWGKFGKLWAQTVRWSMRQGRASDFEVSARQVGHEGRIIVEALDTEASFLNGLSIAGRVLMPDSKGRSIRLHQTGPGRYEGTFPASANGHYVAVLSYTDPKGRQGIIKTGLSVSYSPEYRELTTNEEVLRQIAEQTGGKMLPLNPDKADVFRRPVQPSVHRRPIWHWILGWFVIPLLLLDVAGRRLASMVAISICAELVVFIWLIGPLGLYAYWWGWLPAVLLAEAVGWAIRWRSIPRVIEAIGMELRGLRSAEAATESVSRLKGVRERIREEMAQRDEAQREEAESKASDAPKADASRRYDLGEVGDRGVGDLDHAIGGAKTAEPVAEPGGRRTKSEDKEQDGGPTTSKLLEAKRRAAEQRKQQDNED